MSKPGKTTIEVQGTAIILNPSNSRGLENRPRSTRGWMT